MNQEDLMFEYLLQMGSMRPEELEMLRKQKQIDALRERSADMPQGQMVGKHYVAPAITQYAANALQGYMAGKQQQGQDAAMRDMVDKQRKALEEIRRKKQIESVVGGSNRYNSNFMLPSGDGMNY